MQLLNIKWLDELLCFVDTFLDSSIHSQEIVEETLVWLVDSGYSLKKGRGAAFRYAGLICLEYKEKLGRQSLGQMELFPDISGKKNNSEDKNLLLKALISSRVYRILKHTNLGSYELLNIKKGQTLDALLEADAEIREMNWQPIVLPELKDELILRKVASYVLGLLNEEEGLEVEKKCQADSHWQSLKVWAGQLSRWIEREFIIMGKNGVDQGSYILEPDRFDRCSSLIFQEGDEIIQKPKTANDQGKSQSVKQKDYTLLAYLGAGLFLTFIGYFGWLERNPVEKVEDLSRTLDDQSEKLTIPFPSELEENMSRLILLEAQTQAELILANRTTEKIREMATEMNEVPDSLANFSVNDVQKDSKESAGEYQPSDSGWLGFDFEELKQSISEGYLFIPQGEALGRISISDINQSGIFFGRTDWPNPEKIFSLIAGAYEIRLNLKEAPSLIFLGNCSRRSLAEDTNQSLTAGVPQYLMKVQKGWILDTDQNRTLIQPSN